MGPFLNEFGMASSPVIVDDHVILNLDHDTGSFLVAFDKESGKEIWKVDRGEFPRGYATPVIWMVEGEAQVVVPGTLRVIGYRLTDGKELWTVRGLARIANMTPVIGPTIRSTWRPGLLGPTPMIWFDRLRGGNPAGARQEQERHARGG